MDHSAHAECPTGTALTRVAVSATLHCLPGCAIGEVLGMVIGTALDWSDAQTIVLKGSTHHSAARSTRTRRTEARADGGGASVQAVERSGSSKRVISARLRAPLLKVDPEPRAHDGSEWIYVLSGQMRLILGDQDLVLGTGEAAEFDTQVPHWFGSTGGGQAEVLSIFGRPGERVLVRASGQDVVEDSAKRDPHGL